MPRSPRPHDGPPRRELARRGHFAEISPEVGQLDAEAFDELLDDDPDAALGSSPTWPEPPTAPARARPAPGRTDHGRPGATGAGRHRAVGRLARRPLERRRATWTSTPRWTSWSRPAPVGERPTRERWWSPPGNDPTRRSACWWTGPARCRAHGWRPHRWLRQRSCSGRPPLLGRRVRRGRGGGGAQGAPASPTSGRGPCALRGHGVTDLGLGSGPQPRNSTLERRSTPHHPVVGLPGDLGRRLRTDAAALDELAIIAPAGDTDDAGASPTRSEPGSRPSADRPRSSRRSGRALADLNDPRPDRRPGRSGVPSAPMPAQQTRRRPRRRQMPTVDLAGRGSARLDRPAGDGRAETSHPQHGDAPWRSSPSRRRPPIRNRRSGRRRERPRRPRVTRAPAVVVHAGPATQCERPGALAA